MAHAAPPPNQPRRSARILGLIVVVVGIALLAVTIVSLNRPKEHEVARSTQTGSITTSEVPDATPSASTSTSTSTTSASATPGRSTPVTKASTPTQPSPTATAAGVTKMALVVANATRATGLASTAATRFKAAGWPVSALVNLWGGVPSTCAYYDPANPVAQTAALALQKQFPAIKCVEARFAALPAAPIVVVLSNDYK